MSISDAPSIPGRSGKKRLVALGAGFGALSLLKNLDHECYDCTVISPRNHFLFTPLLPSTTVGTIEFRSVMEPIRAIAPEADFHLAEAISLDRERKRIVCRGIPDDRLFEAPYDVCVIAVGAVSNTYNVPGVTEHALFLKEVKDARAIRQRIIENFERAANPTCPPEERDRYLHAVVVGGGPTGVEFAAEMHDFLAEDLAKAYPTLAKRARITLLEASAQILGAFDAALGEYAMRHFKRQNIAIRTASTVERVERTEIHLADGSRIPYGLCVWSAGVAATRFARELPFEKDLGARLMVDDFLRVSGSGDVYALGDCAALRSFPAPATAQTAQQCGAYLGRQLSARARGKEPAPFRYRHYGMLAYIGGNRALADMASLKGKGFSAFLLWRSAYITKLVGLKNKILVLFDWTKALIFGRDISKM